MKTFKRRWFRYQKTVEKSSKVIRKIDNFAESQKLWVRTKNERACIRYTVLVVPFSLIPSSHPQKVVGEVCR